MSLAGGKFEDGEISYFTRLLKLFFGETKQTRFLQSAEKAFFSSFRFRNHEKFTKSRQKESREEGKEMSIIMFSTEKKHKNLSLLYVNKGVERKRRYLVKHPF